MASALVDQVKDGDRAAIRASLESLGGLSARLENPEVDTTELATSA